MSEGYVDKYGMANMGIQSALSKRQTGLTLLEIMVTIVILSLGLLGLAGLQMTGLKNNRNAYYGSIANMQVQSMAELIHGDVTNMKAGIYNNLGNCNGAAGCTGECDAGADSCPQSQQWLSGVATDLPGGSGRVRANAATPNTFYIAVRWSDPQMKGESGWGGDSATAACGAQVADTNCVYTIYHP